MIIALAGFVVANVLAHFTERLLMGLDGYLRRHAPARLEHAQFQRCHS